MATSCHKCSYTETMESRRLEMGNSIDEDEDEEEGRGRRNNKNVYTV